MKKNRFVMDTDITSDIGSSSNPLQNQITASPTIIHYLTIMKKIFYYNSKMHGDTSLWFSRVQKWYLGVPALALSIVHTALNPISSSFDDDEAGFGKPLDIIMLGLGIITAILIGLQTLLRLTENIVSHDETSFRYEKLFHKTDYCLRFGDDDLMDLIRKIYQKQKYILKDEANIPQRISKKYDKIIDDLYEELLKEDKGNYATLYRKNSNNSLEDENNSVIIQIDNEKESSSSSSSSSSSTSSTSSSSSSSKSESGKSGENTNIPRINIQKIYEERAREELEKQMNKRKKWEMWRLNSHIKKDNI